jgi:hypothetical protein
MDVEAFRFGDSEGGHAAFLWLRPTGAVRVLIPFEVKAVTSAGVTTTEFRNYVLRFHGAIPSVSSSMQEMLIKLPALDSTKPDHDEYGRYAYQSSERLLLGPVSLARFAGRIPPSVAAFRMGGKGRIARFETPGGAMDRIVFEYPSAAVAEERLAAFRSLPGASAEISGRRVGVIFDALATDDANELLQSLPADAVSWDPEFMIHRPMSLEGGIGMVFFGGLIGGLVALLAYRADRNEGIPDRTTSLRI